MPSLISEQTHEVLRKLEERIAQQPPGRWLVLTHDNPDPDSLASATLLAKVLRRRFKQRVTAAYGGIVGRAENQAMMRHLNLKLSRVRHIRFENYRHFALVDCQAQTGNNRLPPEIVPDLVLDHHPKRKQTSDVPLADIRTEYGATASIAAEYLLASELQVSRRNATAVVYAIRSETLDFSRESPGPDRQIYEYFLSRADKRALGKIRNPRLPQHYFASLATALGSLSTVDSLILSHLGPVQQPDIVPELADLMLRLEGKTWSLCTGVHEERIYLSIRTTNPRADASKHMRRLVGRKGKGGGHNMLAGGWTPLNEAQKTDAQKSAKAEREIGRRLAKLLRKNPDRIAPISLTTLVPASPETSPTPQQPAAASK
ncbi:MAG: phosphoesterase [Acidobacteria bacterium]|nr:MAG: phosphoesterase [Acidobacteriota bacterium]REK04331.1 MAG: phosphoesterase [Acidobacteriota bacterium]